MATIEWRPGAAKEYAYLNWTGADGKRHRISLGAISPAEAESQRLAKLLELRTGRQMFSSAPTIDTVAAMYLDWHKAEYPDSHFRVEGIINHLVLPAFRFIAADQLAPLQAERWKAERLKTVSEATAGKEVRTLKAMLAFAVRTGVINTNPIAHVQPPRDRRSQPIHWYTNDELERLYVASGSVSPTRRAVWQLMANTGMRCAEARHLKLEHDRGDTIVIASEPGARTKSRKWREIPLSTNARLALDTLELESRALSAPVLVPILTKNRMTMAFRRDRDRAGLKGSAHSLRHTFGTQLAAKGVPVRVLQQLMGHASIKTTEKYLHVADEHLKQAIKGFNL